MVTELLQKFIWMTQTFIRAGEKGLSLQEITDKWERRYDSPYSRRTFNNHRNAIEEVFGIRIECNRSSNRYYIDSAESLTDGETESAWLINTFTVNNILTESRNRLSGRISVEDIPSGHRHLTTLMEAMESGNVIRIGYRKYTSSIAEEFSIYPYAVKEFAKRWYLVGHCRERDGLRVYGLDRITSLEITDAAFEMPGGFDVDELFATSFGIYLPKDKAVYVEFRADEKEARFLRDLPLHKSQEETGTDGEWVRFRIFACPDKNMIMEFCKYGGRVEVLSPESVRESVRQQFADALDLYCTPVRNRTATVRTGI